MKTPLGLVSIVPAPFFYATLQLVIQLGIDKKIK
jgi:hypothetical protein